MSRETWREALDLLDEVGTVPAEERARFLEEQGVPPAVRLCLDRLLQSESTAQGEDELDDLDRAVAAVLGEVQKAVPDLRGRLFGPFRIEAPLGRGGMSAVYRARRTEGPIEQEAALKLLPLATLNRGGLDRFRREQAILAQLRHPNITTLLDGGIAEDGTPWIAMELVEGRPIDEYVDAQDLDARAIVRLCLPVCRAIEYAHRNLVVHRDLKPGNVLVDEDGQVHLLDFGVAKLVEEAEPEAAQATATLALTPDYCAPEQLQGRPPTTATDVFGLGALLFRLLANRVPYPSRRHGPLDPARFERLDLPAKSGVAGLSIDRDLELVLRRALHPDPEQRYGTAAALSADLERWLDGRAVEAGPDRASYRLRRLLSRHRTATTAAALVLLSLGAGLATTLWQAHRARENARQAALEAARARREATLAEQATRFLVDTFGAADPLATSGEEVTAREIVETAAERIDAELDASPQTRFRLLVTLGNVSYNLGDFRRAEALVEEALHLPGVPLERRADAHRILGMTRFMLGDRETAEAHYEKGLELIDGKSAPAQLRVQLVLGLAQTRVDSGRPEAARDLLTGALAAPALQPASEHPVLRARLSQQLARALLAGGHYRAAVEPARRAVEALAEAKGRDDADYASALRTLADVESQLGDLEAAEAAERQSMEIFQRIYGRAHTKTLESRNNLATLLKARGEFDESARLLETVAEAQEKLLGAEHPYLAVTLSNLGEAYFYDGRLEKARLAYHRAWSTSEATAGAKDPTPAILRALHARVRGRLGRAEQARQEFEWSLERLRGAVGPEHPLAARIAILFAAFLNDQGHHGEAAEHAARSLPLLEEAYPEGSTRIALAELELGRALLETGPEERGATLLRRAERTLAKSPRRRQYHQEISLARSLLGDDER